MLDIIVGISKVTSWGLKIYSWAHIIAFLLSWISADPTNKYVSFIYRITHPLWHWVGQRIPRKVNPFAPIFALMLVIFGEIAAPGVIRSIGAVGTGALGFSAGGLNGVYYLIIGALYITSSAIGFIMLLAIVWFVFTLVNPPLNNPIVRSIMVLIDPLITPLQRILPRASVDLSPIVLALIAFFARTGISMIMAPIQANIII